MNAVDSAAGLTAGLSALHLCLAMPCAERAWRLAVAGDPMPYAASPRRRRTAIIGMVFIAALTIHLGVWRFFGSTQFVLDVWTASSVSAVWFSLGAVEAIVAAGILLWGMEVANPDTDAGYARAHRHWRACMILSAGVALGGYSISAAT